MATNQYIAVTELPPGWTNEQRLAIRGAVGALGPQSTSSPRAGGQPANVTHSRACTDGTKILFRAMFDDAEITRANIVATIAAALGLTEVAVDAKIDYSVLGPDPAGKNYVMLDPVKWGDAEA
jgi:hypothetical protein